MLDFSVFAHADAWVALLTLTAMEVVLGIDNIVFISIMTAKLPENQQAKARTMGLSLALFSRLGLLFTITWFMRLTSDLFTFAGHGISGRDLILGIGGLFLLGKATHEIFERVEFDEDPDRPKKQLSFASVIVQILILDVVFSLDSVITAVGMAEHLVIMVIAVTIAVGVMLLASGAISRFIDSNPSMRVLALSFLMLIGVMLIAESLDQHIDKGYIYFAMGYALLVELFNIRTRKRRGSVAAAK